MRSTALRGVEPLHQHDRWPSNSVRGTTRPTVRVVQRRRAEHHHRTGIAGHGLERGQRDDPRRGGRDQLRTAGGPGAGHDPAPLRDHVAGDRRGRRGCRRGRRSTPPRPARRPNRPPPPRRRRGRGGGRAPTVGGRDASGAPTLRPSSPRTSHDMLDRVGQRHDHEVVRTRAELGEPVRDLGGATFELVPRQRRLGAVGVREAGRVLVAVLRRETRELAPVADLLVHSLPLLDQALGPKRSTRIRDASTPSPVTRSPTASANGADPHTYTVASARRSGRGRRR